MIAKHAIVDPPLVVSVSLHASLVLFASLAVVSFDRKGVITVLIAVYARNFLWFVDTRCCPNIEVCRKVKSEKSHYVPQQCVDSGQLRSQFL